jgi:hypothetical protein
MLLTTVIQFRPSSCGFWMMNKGSTKGGWYWWNHLYHFLLLSSDRKASLLHRRYLPDSRHFMWSIQGNFLRANFINFSRWIHPLNDLNLFKAFALLKPLKHDFYVSLDFEICIFGFLGFLVSSSAAWEKWSIVCWIYLRRSPQASAHKSVKFNFSIRIHYKVHWIFMSPELLLPPFWRCL